MADVTADQVEIGRAPDTGTPVVGNRHIPVRNIAQWHQNRGWTLDDIATECGLTLEQVNAALAYYHDHQADCDRPG